MQAIRDEAWDPEEALMMHNLFPFIVQMLRRDWVVTTVIKRNSITVRGDRKDGIGWSRRKGDPEW